MSPGTCLPLQPPMDGLQASIRRIQSRRATSEADRESLHENGRNHLSHSLYNANARNNTSLGVGMYKKNTHDVRSTGRLNVAEDNGAGAFLPMINHSPARSDMQSYNAFKRPPIGSQHAMTSLKHNYAGDKFMFLKA